MTEATEPLDLASLSAQKACETPFEFELKHPVTEEGLGVFISVVGTESEAFKAHTRKKANAALARQFKNQRRSRDEAAPTVEQAEKDGIDLVVACTVGWRTGETPKITHAGKALEFSESNARFIYAERWIRDQAAEAIGDLGNFMQA